MIDWDDVRYLLAVAREGSVRAAAERLEVNHSTVLRRVAQLEERLGAQMFEKLPSGYRLTDAGEEVLEFAEQMEASSNQLAARVFGRDQSARGLLRVTLAPTLATHVLMPDLADFTRLHPEIEVEILSSDEPVNLTNREADVAIRVVYNRSTLPLNPVRPTAPFARVRRKQSSATRRRGRVEPEMRVAAPSPPIPG
jgi:molybdate transport repressor ModE-like protein